MKTSRITLPVLLATIAACFAMLMIATSAYAQNQGLLGKWNMTSTAPDNDVLWTLTIEYKDGKYEATSGTSEGAGPVQGLRVEGNAVHFSVDYRGGEYAIDLTLQGDSLTGTWSGQGDSGQTKGQRST